MAPSAASLVLMAWKALRRYKYNGIQMGWLDFDGMDRPQTLQTWGVRIIGLVVMARKALRRYKYNGIRITWFDFDGLEDPQTLQI